MVAPVILVEAQPRRAADGGPVTVRLAGGGADHPYTYFDQHWRAGIDGLPGTIASLDFDGEQLGGGGVAQAMTVRWAPAGAAALAELAALYWGDAAVTVRIGPEGAPPPVVTAGLVLDVASEGGALKIALADQAPALKRPLLVDRFAGTGDLEGPAEWKGLIKTRAWGRCFNVPGKCIDPANNIWSFGDPGRPWQAFHQVRDRGATAAALTVVGWAGSIAATLAALRAVATPEGGGAACPSLACVRWWKEPSGDLHADISGETAGGYVETAPEIAARIVAAAAGVAIGFVPGAVAAAAAARPDPFGWRVTAESATAAGELSALLGDVSLSWLVAGEAIDFRRWDWSAPVRTARSQSVVRRQVFKPLKARRLGYRRNQAPMARGDIAAAVLVGLDAVLITLSADKPFAKYDGDDHYVGGPIRFTAIRQNIPGTNTYFAIHRVSDNSLLTANTSEGFAAATPAYWAGSGGDVLVLSAAAVSDYIAGHGAIRIVAYRDGYPVTDSVTIAKVKDGSPGLAAPLVLTQFSVTGSGGWHLEPTGADVFARQSNDGGVTWGAAYRIQGEASEGIDGKSPSVVFKRSATVPAAPADNSGDPPAGWSDGPPPTAGLLWQSKATFREGVQLTGWSAPVRITGDPGADAIVAALKTALWIVAASSAGVTKDGQLPLYSTLQVKKGGADITGDCVVAVTPSSEDRIAASFTAPNVYLNSANADGFVDVAVSYQGAAVPGSPFRLQVQRKLDPAPPQAATQATGAIRSSTTSATYQGPLASDDTVSLRVGASGAITLNVFVSYGTSRPSNATVRLYTMAGTLAYRPAGGSAWSYAGPQMTGSEASNRGGFEAEAWDGELSGQDIVIAGLPAGLYEFGFATIRTSGNAPAAFANGSYTVRAA